MSFNLFRTCMAPLAVIGFLTLPGCSTRHLSAVPASSAPPPPSLQGHRYYSRQDGKLLGSDSSGSPGYRLIDAAVFTRISRAQHGITGAMAVRELTDSSLPVTVDNDRIQSDLQLIRDSSLVYKVEYSLYIFIDRNTGIVSSIREQPGTNTRSSIEVIPSRRYGVTYPRVGNVPPDSRILIAQVHGHPPILDQRQRTLPCMSDTDQLAARYLQVPIYGIDAMNGRPGDAARIHRANPDPDPGAGIPTQDLNVGETCGTAAVRSAATSGQGTAAPGFDIGLDALKIWGRSRAPWFNAIAQWNKNMGNSVARAARTRDTGPVRTFNR